MTEKQIYQRYCKQKYVPMNDISKYLNDQFKLGYDRYTINMHPMNHPLVIVSGDKENIEKSEFSKKKKTSKKSTEK